jgi:hypothetical protein
VPLTAIILMLRDRGNITKLPKKKNAAELSSSVAEEYLAFKIWFIDKNDSPQCSLASITNFIFGEEEGVVVVTWP